MDLKSAYRQKRSTAERRVQELKKKDHAFSALRLALGVLAIAFAYFMLLFSSYWLGLFFILLVVVFGFTVQAHQRIRKHMTFHAALRDINDGELQYHESDFTSFSDGSFFREEAHLFSDDLDLFGPRSLYQRIHRCTSQRGNELLAEQLRSNDMENIDQKQAAIQELAAMVDWRQAYLATAQGVGSLGTSNKVQKWAQSPILKHRMMHPSVLWSLTFLFPITCFVVLFAFGLSAIDWLIYPFLLNLFLFSRVLKSLQKDHAFVDQLSKDFEVKSKLIAMIENQDWKSHHIRDKVSQLSTSRTKASKAIKQLSSILSRMDSINNAIGALLLNGLCFYHLHVYRNALKWKSTFGQEIETWLDVLVHFEIWISLSNYAYNHPDFVYPTLEGNMQFEAKGIGHPFIASSDLVTNNVDFDAFKVMILTGSNMAGKSTFLRSIGLAIVMSGLGLPVCASALKLSPFKLLSSMKPQDSVNDNTSYFQAEINRLRAIMDKMENDQPVFLLLDEILRGTNSLDKRNGTQAFLEKIKDYRIKGIIATHDVEIAELTYRDRKTYNNQFFESKQIGEDLNFDYKLRSGVCQTPNATQLLKMKGII